MCVCGSFEFARAVFAITKKAQRKTENIKTKRKKFFAFFLWILHVDVDSQETIHRAAHKSCVRLDAFIGKLLCREWETAQEENKCGKWKESCMYTQKALAKWCLLRGIRCMVPYLCSASSVGHVLACVCACVYLGEIASCVLCRRNANIRNKLYKTKKYTNDARTQHTAHSRRLTLTRISFYYCYISVCSLLSSTDCMALCVLLKPQSIHSPKLNHP